ncbi:MAG: type II toxin-antitoxin system PemK/MazF family toxin [Acutalibacteraceae bacterium]|nr:type II toxin-antitoxin system PemK/MazF family toxin [Acutalibacteraceae bacterium]
MILEKGEIYYISNPTSESFGTELQKDRPAVIISVKGEYPESAGAVVAFLTTKPKNFSDFHCTIQSSGRPATVLVEQMKYIDVARVGKKIGVVNEEEMQLIDGCILKVHGIKRADEELREKDKIIKELKKAVEEKEIQLGTYQNMLTTLYTEKA